MKASIEEFPALVQPLLGLPVSSPWKGYGSAIFLELGELAPLAPNRRHRSGQACISICWDWRVEAEATILYGSSNSGPRIESGLGLLQDATLQNLILSGKVPEIEARFSNGLRLSSKAMITGHPEWSICLPDGRWLHAKGGELRIGSDGGPALTEEEKAVFESARRSASRWGVPVSEPKRGSCTDCANFVRLDGNGNLLDYGVCVADGGPFDGKAVNRNSGCPLFNPRPQ